MSQELQRRRDAGILQVTERDITVLTWISEQYCISYDHLQYLLALYTPATTKHPDKVAPSTAYNAIDRWIKLGYVDTPQKVIREHATYLWLSRRGIKELDLPYAYYTPKPSTIRHIYAVNTIRLHMQSFHLKSQWIAQRSIKLQIEQRPIPDAHMELQTFPLIAIKVLEQQHLATITIQEEISALKALSERYARIRCFVHAHSLETLKDAIGKQDKEMSKDDQLANRIIWYSLDAKELEGQKKQKPA